jgi:hypothetical protein
MMVPDIAPSMLVWRCGRSVIGHPDYGESVIREVQYQEESSVNIGNSSIGAD